MYIIRDGKRNLLQVRLESPELHESVLEVRAMLLDAEVLESPLLTVAEAEEKLREIIEDEDEYES